MFVTDCIQIVEECFTYVVLVAPSLVRLVVLFIGYITFVL